MEATRLAPLLPQKFRRQVTNLGRRVCGSPSGTGPILVKYHETGQGNLKKKISICVTFFGATLGAAGSIPVSENIVLSVTIDS